MSEPVRTAVVPRVCEVLGGPWDGDHVTARPWPLEVWDSTQTAIMGRYTLARREETATTECGTVVTRVVCVWVWTPEGA